MPAEGARTDKEFMTYWILFTATDSILRTREEHRYIDSKLMHPSIYLQHSYIESNVNTTQMETDVNWGGDADLV